MRPRPRRPLVHTDFHYDSFSLFCILFFIRPQQKVPITTDVVFKSRSGWGVQHYMIKFVSDLWQVDGFSGFLNKKNWPPRYTSNWNIVFYQCYRDADFLVCLMLCLFFFWLKLHIFYCYTYYIMKTQFVEFDNFYISRIYIYMRIELYANVDSIILTKRKINKALNKQENQRLCDIDKKWSILWLVL
jgi:hypothetical protein